MALLFRGGAAIPRDMDAARHWYQAAAAQGHRASLESLRLLASEGDGGAFYALGILNRDGLGVPHDAKAARTAFKWAGEEGHVLGLFAEADMLAAGVGGASDEVAAMTRYGQIADLARTELNFSQEDPAGEPRGGDARAAAQYWIGKLYLAGAAGLRQNAVEAATWFAGAAQAGVAMAQYELGLLYRQGRGVPRDRARALAWLESAAAKGMPGAQQEIERMGRDQ